MPVGTPATYGGAAITLQGLRDSEVYNEYSAYQRTGEVSSKRATGPLNKSQAS